MNRSKRAVIGYEVRTIVSGADGDPLKAITDHLDVLRRQLTMTALYPESIREGTVESLEVRARQVGEAAFRLADRISTIGSP